MTNTATAMPNRLHCWPLYLFVFSFFRHLFCIQPV